MREIKFRAWNKEKNRWFNGGTNNHVLAGDGIVVSVRYKPYADGTWKPYECRQLTWPEIEQLEISQYTGLKDKNGKEIYEGDILRQWHYQNDFGNEKENECRNGIVVWDDTYPLRHCWSVKEHRKYKNGYETDSMTMFVQENRREIIGNIYENPELLEG